MNKTIAAAVIALSFATALPAFAETTAGTANTGGKIACVGAAVNAREQALDAAMTTFTGALNASYSARATALASAYTQTTPSAVKAAVKTAWATFSSSVKSARKAWQSARNSAWTTFRAAAKACKAPAGVGDEGNSGIEASGN